MQALLQDQKVIPVITLHNADHAIPLAEALKEAGIRCIEITLRTKVALESIKRATTVPGMLIGAGTVLRAKQFHEVAEAGAAFAVSPGFTKPLAKAAKDSGLPWLPGAVTATEIMRAQAAGYARLKFFPAEAAGGVAALKAMGSVFSDVSFCPTGGVTPQNAKDYLALKNVFAVGGSWLATDELIQRGDWAEITRRAREVGSPVPA